MPPMVVVAMLPVCCPLHTISVGLVVIIKVSGCVMVRLILFVQPTASVTVKVYVSAKTLIRFGVLALLLHVYVYGILPPDTLVLILPVWV